MTLSACSDRVTVSAPSAHAGFTGAMESSPSPTPVRPELTMDAIQLLKADHKKVKELLAELAETTTRATKKRADLLS